MRLPAPPKALEQAALDDSSKMACVDPESSFRMFKTKSKDKIKKVRELMVKVITTANANYLTRLKNAITELYKQGRRVDDAWEAYVTKRNNLKQSEKTPEFINCRNMCSESMAEIEKLVDVTWDVHRINHLPRTQE